MYIEEIILEGFKSYATRTSISGWDPEFNAITGLNGTGKSNILDAICFVLGIDNLRQVRAASLQDLVYKKGQAGITKAAVTIVFNNGDRTTSPIGFADCPQITVTRQIILNGKNKYLINGHNVQQKSVENLFQSVQLNVNNPHFLIMQGQITRVLNMKPVETLALIEETAGTRMFEDRKSKAINTLDKKERKVEEIAALLTDTIEPKLGSLKAERSDFLEYKRTEAELERQQRLVKAYEYNKLGQEKLAVENNLSNAKLQMQETSKEIKVTRLDFEQVTDEIFNITKRKEKESKANSKLRELEENCKEASTKVMKLQTEIDFKKDALSTEEATLEKLKGDDKLEKDRLATLQQSLLRIKEKHDTAKDRRDTIFKELKEDEELLRSLETGLSSDDSSKGTGFAKLLNDSRNALTSSQTVKHQAEQKIKQLKNELTTMDDTVKGALSQNKDFQEAITQLERSISELRSHPSLGKSGTDNKSTLYTEVDSLKDQLTTLKYEHDSLKGSTASVEFNYTLSKGFDHSRIQGSVAKLISLSSDTLRFANALESCAGARMYNIVVDSEQTAALLLEQGKLARRVTFIPLSKIQSRIIPEDKVRQVFELTHGKAHLALKLVQFDSAVLPAVQYVFGSTFICETKEAANLVAFDKLLGFRAVTLEGDIYEPYGTLSGGSITNFSGILSKLYALNSNAKLIEEYNEKLNILERQLAEKKKEYHLEAQVRRDLQMKEGELADLKRKMNLGKPGQILARYNELNDLLKENEKALQEAEAKITTLEASCAKYERESVELDQNRDGKLTEIRKRIAKLRKTLDNDEKQYKKLDAEFQKIANDHDATEVLLGEFDVKRGSIEADLKRMEQELSSLVEEHLQTMTRHNGLRVRLDTESKNMRQFDAELMSLETRKRTLQELVEDLELKSRELTDKIDGYERSQKKLEERLQLLLSTNLWILDFQDQFGKANSPFDFTKHNMGDVAKHVKVLESQRDTLRKSINFNVIDMLDRVEAKDTSLRQMLNTVKRDRTKIESTIVKLNDYMLDTLNKTWKKVSNDFGEILAELLPGSSARLDLIEGEPITSGLEIHVCLGGVWKQSLAELSGGQRSLVALALILALLQYRPAPMYILDEVDAALDLSHTENIGRLLKSRFKGSQFIVVSLKEGMFSNANVLFRTRFRDGVSGVERIAKNEDKTRQKQVKKASKQIALRVQNTVAL